MIRRSAPLAVFVSAFCFLWDAPRPVASYRINQQHLPPQEQPQRHVLLRSTDAASSSLSSTSSTPSSWVRLPAVKRVYGSENQAVRAEVRRLEERMPRYQTGIPGDPNHAVPYERHPYEKSRWYRRLERQRRYLQDGNATTATDDATATTDDGSSAANGNETSAESSPQLFQPMRFKFFTDALEAIRDDSNGAKIDWYVNTVLPKTAEFWSRALSVVPVSGNLQISASELDSRVYCGDSEFTEVPSEHISDGVPDVDLILYVSGSADSRFCPERTLAVAVPCNFDQFDRPTAGAVNVCLDNIELLDDGTATDAVVQDYVDVTVHEVGHVLGHSSNSYRFYWDPSTGEPRTPRPFEATTVTCVNGVERTLVVPAENTVKFVTTNGQTYAAVVTEKVAAVARNQFDCQSLDGAFLENEPTREDSCIGDHWDERLFYPETMSPVISPTTNIFSSLTLALMEDSGWYKANYTVSSMSPWGLGAGCDFVNEPCLVPSGSSGSNPTIPDYGKGFFCNAEGVKGCSPELTTKLACTVLDYQYYVPEIAIPEAFQYFSGSPTMGGPQQADFCPVYGSPYSSKTADQLDCRNPDNSGQFLNAYEEKFGVDSQCIETTSADGLCFRTACVRDLMAVRINVIGEWHTCEYDFQEITVRLGEGLIPVTLICPRLAQACPGLFCPFNCAGRGVCNYANVDGNGTVRPKCECFDTSDTSEACSDSMIPDGGFLDDSSGLFDNIEQNFFDPLIAVFVDPPDSWSTASWAWAGGLIVIFVILLLCICSSLCPSQNKKAASV